MSNSEKGYGKPPKATQFKKGQSGNPSGKKKHKNNFKSLDRTLRDTLLQEVTIQINGKPRKMLRLEAIVAKQYVLAMEGNVQSAKFLVGLAERHVPTHQTLEDLMDGRPVFEFTEAEAKRFTRAKLLEGIEFPEDIPDPAEEEYLESVETAGDEDLIESTSPQGTKQE